MNDILDLPSLEYFRSFVVFVDSPNIVVAADKLKISQPLLSKHLKALEEVVGTPLFEFSGRKKVLTELGRNLYQLLSRHLDQLGAGFHQALAMQTQARAVRIGGRKEILETVALNLRYGNSLTYSALDSEEVGRLLLDKKIEIGISQKDLDSNRLVRKKLWADEFVLCWNSDIKGIAQKSIREALMEISAYRCYDYPGKSVLEAVLQKAKVHLPNSYTTFADWKVIAEILRKEPAWSILPIGYASGSGLQFTELPADVSHRSQFYIYYQKEFAKLPWFQDLVKNIIATR